jgi:sporulation protein YlmC with PRC-barrel domain
VAFPPSIAGFPGLRELTECHTVEPGRIAVGLLAGGCVMRAGVLVTIAVFIAGVFVTTSMAQTAGSSLITTNEMREVASGWSAKKQILGKDVYNDSGEKIGDINDLIVAPSRAVSYAIVGVGGFLGMNEHNVAVPVSKLKQQMGKIVLPGATKDALKAAPEFEYATK